MYGRKRLINSTQDLAQEIRKLRCELEQLRDRECKRHDYERSCGYEHKYEHEHEYIYRHEHEREYEHLRDALERLNCAIDHLCDHASIRQSHGSSHAPPPPYPPYPPFPPYPQFPPYPPFPPYPSYPPSSPSNGAGVPCGGMPSSHPPVHPCSDSPPKMHSSSSSSSSSSNRFFPTR
jgi:hypothetical protein